MCRNLKIVNKPIGKTNKITIVKEKSLSHKNKSAFQMILEKEERKIQKN